ncbi:DUF2867 domain-containing protein [Shimia marina]|uniref:DUF2867 domain-containing protein n=1 Tax=Shimia marina TaxID=321267 RepID=A0A0P1ER67_9RHOB|nr:DUF2867 domain-containing protein [Shimia marina]CUH52738.1 hypothetical protein SHM7688_02185 [Shimia marina]SFE79498.1 Protein of unknown function [Shimia marina]
MLTLDHAHVRVLAPVAELYYFDQQHTVLQHDMTALLAWNAIMQQPQPFLNLAFKIRDTVSSLFGVKRIGGFSGRAAQSVQVGDHLDFFLVEYVDDTCLVLTERDRHLDVMTCISVQGRTLTVTSSVCVHNWFGRAYMVPVGIAHRWIVRGMFKRLSRHG